MLGLSALETRAVGSRSIIPPAAKDSPRSEKANGRKKCIPYKRFWKMVSNI